MALGVPEDRATGITAAIVDWRTPADPLHTSPFDAFYLAQSPSFLPRHTSFQENEELLLVDGITPDLYYGTSLDNSRAGLRDCISVFANGGALDVDATREETFVAVGISQEDAAAIVRARAQHPILDYGELSTIRQPSARPSAPGHRRPDNVYPPRHRPHEAARWQALRSAPHRGRSGEIQRPGK